MKPQDLLAQELEFSSVVVKAVLWARWWLLVAMALVAVAACIWVKWQPQLGKVQVEYTLNANRVNWLASAYTEFPKGSPILLGQLEIDSLFRFGQQLSDPALWQQLWADPTFCTAQNDLCQQQSAQSWRNRLLVEHKRRGNILSLSLAAADLAEAEIVLAALLRLAQQQDQNQYSTTVKLGVEAAQRALEQANSVGERSELALQLSQASAQWHLWQQGAYPILQEVTSVQAKPAKTRSLAVVAVFGALMGLLAGLLVAVVLVKP